ncbi:GGDEF family protein [Vibrio sp. RC586]|uniref:sensor domain-containing diguanylate cyclase n=1 Tax=Vibrio sp. RC586 TaxID=675815 RepID=UPI0001BB82C2|nr:diguanylate cyclase [Vibrio sp. RC586]EEY98168.1 GGDEF family protein [Vibrio sp. RC586]
MPHRFGGKLQHAVLISSLFLTSVLVYTAYSLQKRYNVTIFENLADRQTQALQQFVESDIHFIGSAANFFQSTSMEDWDHFQSFAAQTIKDSNSLIGLQWMAKVEADQLPEYTQKIQALFPSFLPYTVLENGKKTNGYVFSGEPVYVLSDIYPLTEANRDLLGFYSSRERFQEVLNYIMNTGKASISDKVRLLQDGIDKSIKKDGILVYHPVLSSKQDQDLLGVMVGVVRLSAYIDNLVLKTAMEQQLRIQVIDTGFDADDDPILYQSEGWQEGKGVPMQKRVHLPNRDWIIKYCLLEPLTQNDKWILFGMSLGGVVISLLLSYITRLLIEERVRLEVMLDERTAELRYLVEHDSLTSIYNRRYFNQLLPSMLDASQPFTLVIFDIDHFKQINDSYGHLVGDQALVHVVNLVMQKLKPEDHFVRMGGDEFAILSYVVDGDALSRYLEAIRVKVEQTPLLVKTESVGLTVSIGASPNHGMSEFELLHCADTQLYLSKSLGRNQVSIAQQCSNAESNFAVDSGRMFDFM